MKVALITDLHYGARSDITIFHDFYKKFNDKFFEILDSRKIERVFMLGDLFDRRKYINFITAKRCREDFLEPLNSRGLDVDMIAGNHDVFYKNTNDVSALNELLRPYNFKIHYNPVESMIGDEKVLLLPWITDSNVDQTYTMIRDTDAKLCFGHLEIEGFEMLRGIEMDHGLKREIFNKFDIVASGHFHHRSVVGNIHYIGAAYEQIWSDYADPKGFSIFDTETREFEFILNTNNMFHMIKYDDVAGKSKIMNLIKKGDFSRFRDAFVKVVTVNKNDPYLFDQFIDRIYQESPYDISIIEDMSNFIETDPENEIDQAEDTIIILDRYIDGLQINLDSNRLKRSMRNIYNEALSLENSGEMYDG